MYLSKFKVFLKDTWIIFIALILIGGCSSPGVQQIQPVEKDPNSNSVYCYKVMYLSRIIIKGYIIFFICDKNGDPLPNMQSVTTGYSDDDKTVSHSIVYGTNQ